MNTPATKMLAHLQARRSDIDDGWTALSELRRASGYKGDKLPSIVAMLPGAESRGGWDRTFQVRLKQAKGVTA